MDRMPELPGDVIQHIQSFMDIEEGTRSTLLSKSWLRAWSTRPFLDFDFCPSDDTLIKLVDTTLETYLQHGLPILKLRLLTSDTIKERWLKLLLQKQNNLIELHLYSYRRVEGYEDIWQDIFRTKSLRVLEVEGGLPVDLILSPKNIKCHNLKKIVLCRVKFDDHTFQHIIRYCPLIEECQLVCCSLLNFCAADLPNLRVLQLRHMIKNESIDLSNAPRLQSFTFDGALEFNVRFGACASLKRLVLSHTKITDEQLQTILSKNPQLEDLIIFCCYKTVWQINLSSLSLRCLQHYNLDKYQNQVQLIIDAPNLHTLSYSSLRTTPFPITSPATTKGEVTVNIDYIDLKLNASWFLGLREFLARFEKSTVEFTWNGMRFTSRMLRAIPLRHNVQVLKIRYREVAGLLLLYAFFNICHPKTVLLRCPNYTSGLPYLKKLGKALSYRGNLACCKFDQNKCWRHYIKDAKICYVVNNEQKPFEINGLGMDEESAAWFDISLALEWE